MKIFKGFFVVLLGLGSILILFPIRVSAFCPLCVVATGVFASFFRWLGVDDTIIGLWLGGFIFSISAVFNNFLIKKRKKIRFQIFLIFFVFYSFIVLFLYQFGALAPYNKIFGIDKIFFGMILGGLLLSLSPYVDKFLRKQNQGKIFISHQKMLIAIILLIIFTLILYFIL